MSWTGHFRQRVWSANDPPKHRDLNSCLQLHYQSHYVVSHHTETWHLHACRVSWLLAKLANTAAKQRLAVCRASLQQRSLPIRVGNKTTCFAQVLCRAPNHSLTQEVKRMSNGAWRDGSGAKGICWANTRTSVLRPSPRYKTGCCHICNPSTMGSRGRWVIGA